MKLTKAKAKKLCIKKWEWIVENEIGKYINTTLTDFEEFEKIKDEVFDCAYCCLYNNVKESSCPKCPIVKKFLSKECCKRKKSTFNKWFDNPTDENAQKMLDLIKKT